MPGQANLNAFLAKPAPGKAAPTQVVPPAPGQRPSPRQQQQAANAGGQKAQQLALQQQKAAQAQQRISQGQQRVDQAQERIDLRKQQETRLQTGQNVKLVDRATQPLKDRFAGLNEWASHIPTPGGIGVLLFLIFLLLWAVVPVNGKHTRAELLWLTLIGRTKMAPTPDGGGSFDASEKATGSGGIGSGGNGHSITATTDLLSQMGVIDFGGGWN